MVDDINNVILMMQGPRTVEGEEMSLRDQMETELIRMSQVLAHSLVFLYIVLLIIVYCKSCSCCDTISTPGILSISCCVWAPPKK
jgi:hypothetical protein